MWSGSDRSGTLRFAFAGALVLTAGTASANAQTCAQGVERVGWIGVTGLECNCVNAVPSRGTWEFRSEPVVSRIEPGSPADGRLETGDVIVAVDGWLITTEEGGRRYGEAAPGSAMRLTVRRDGRLIEVTVTPIAICMNDERLTFAPTSARNAELMQALGARARAEAANVDRSMIEVLRARELERADAASRVERLERSALRARELDTQARQRELEALSRALRAGERERSEAVAQERRALEALQSARVRAQGSGIVPVQPDGGWFGFGLNCARCGWEQTATDTEPRWTFSEHPTVMLVEPGSPAARAGLRTGDVLTHIDGESLLTPEGGRRFGAVDPGQTVRWTYRRGEASHTVSITAIERPRTPAALTETLLDSLRMISARRPDAAPPAEYRQSVERLEAQYRELLARQAPRPDTVRRAGPRPALEAPRPPTPGTLRFSGSVGNVDVEVRGDQNIVTTIVEEGREILIQTSSGVIRLRVPRGR